ncbi:MAG: trypsin-like peptidase domain-containing protein [Oculatellaceae cyanobacterium bins.114]|nr:trypsin-like peptidase domain-containing protein [Oculatellaceae cyanobacterium bins.114]
MNTRFLRTATSGLILIGTTASLITLDAIAPIHLLSLNRLGQPDSHAAFAQDTEDSINVRVYEQASPAVVSIETRDGTGSGSIISSDGLILTNAHVVGDERAVTVSLADGREFQGEVVAYGEPGLDLAAVRIRGQNNLPTIRLARSGTVQVGQRAFAIGNPFGQFQGTLTTGIVSRIDRERGLVQTDAAINPGNSGGPLLNSQGELIGVNTAIFTPRGSSGNIGIGFAISIERVQPFLTAVREGRAPRTAQQQPLPGVTRPPQSIALNRPVQGRLDRGSNVLPADNSYFDAYTFEGRAGQQIVIDMSSSDIDTYLILLTPDGSDLAQDDDGGGGTNSRIVATLPASGTYTVFANSYGAGEVGTYNLRVVTQGNSASTPSPRPVPSPTPPRNVPGQVGLILREEGILGPGAQVLESDGSLYREHTFRGNAGQTVTVTMESSEFDTYLILVGPDNQVIDQNDDIGPENFNSSITTTLPASGTYRIIANAYDSNGRGRYLVTVR